MSENNYGTLQKPIKISPNTEGCVKPSELLYSLMRDMDVEPIPPENRVCVSYAFIKMLDVEQRLTTGKPLDYNNTFYGFKLIDAEYPDKSLGADSKDDTRIIITGILDRGNALYDVTHTYWVNGMKL